jgi:hypothetical protein
MILAEATCQSARILPGWDSIKRRTRHAETGLSGMITAARAAMNGERWADIAHHIHKTFDDSLTAGYCLIKSAYLLTETHIQLIEFMMKIVHIGLLSDGDRLPQQKNRLPPRGKHSPEHRNRSTPCGKRCPNDGQGRILGNIT